VVLDSLCVLSSLVCEEQQAVALLHQLAALGEVLQVSAAFEGAGNNYLLVLPSVFGGFSWMLSWFLGAVSVMPACAQQCLVRTYDCMCQPSPQQLGSTWAQHHDVVRPR
jgi:hypothetical protein